MKEKSIISLNQDLNSEFMIQELEQRLETDPLFALNPTDLSSGVSSTCGLVACFSLSCTEIFS